MTDDGEGSRRGMKSKVARLIEEYDLQGLGPELEELWTAEEDRCSLRSLADYFNQRLLGVSIEDSDIQLLDGELENIYRLLTAEAVSSADRTRVRRRLERSGVAVDDLESDFVTYQAIRSYLKDQGAEYSPDDADPIDRQLTEVQKLRGRMSSVTDGQLEQLRSNDQFTLGTFRTLATIQVICEDCNSQFGVVDLLKRGGCDCSDQSE